MKTVQSHVTQDNRVIAVTPPPTHGNCPGCKVSLDGDGIWLTFYHQAIEDGKTKEEAIAHADKTCSDYYTTTASREKGRWGRAIGLVENDRCSKFACPECGTVWRLDGSIVEGETIDVAAYIERRANG